MLGFTSSSFEYLGGNVAGISAFLTCDVLGFLKSVALSLTLEPNDPTTFFGYPALYFLAIVVFVSCGAIVFEFSLAPPPVPVRVPEAPLADPVFLFY